MSDSRTMLEKLVGYATVSRDSNLDLIGFVEAHLARLGFDCQLIHSEDGRKANLFASVGPADRPGILLSGHTDVVPVEGQEWSSDPFRLREEAGRYHGRGTADMKGFIACCLAAAPAMAGAELTVPLQFAFSYDEEVGCLGVRRLIAMLETLPVRPRCCIIGEPTAMQIVTAHKGKMALKAICTGLEAHSSLAPDGVNAVHLACDLVAALRRLQDEIAASGARDGDYDVAYTTVHVGRFHGGETLNIVPNRATVDFEIRHLPADDPRALLARIEAAARAIAGKAQHRFPGAAVDVAEVSSYPALETPPDDAAVAFVRKLTGGNSLGKISFGTEGGLFRQRLGVPAIVCGPGSIAVAHRPDEYIEAAQLALCDRFLGRLIAELSSNGMAP